MLLANVNKLIKVAREILKNEECSIDEAIDTSVKILEKHEYEGMLIYEYFD